MSDSPSFPSPTADEIATIIRPLARDTAELRECARLFTQDAYELNRFSLSALVFTIALPIPWATLMGATGRRTIDFRTVAEGALIILGEIANALPTELRLGRWIIDPYDKLYLIDLLRQGSFPNIKELDDVFLPLFQLAQHLLFIRTNRITEIMTENIEKDLSDPATHRESLATDFALMLLKETSPRYHNITSSTVESQMKDLIALTPSVRQRFDEVCRAMTILSEPGRLVPSFAGNDVSVHA